MEYSVGVDPAGGQPVEPGLEPENIYKPQARSSKWLWIALGAVFVLAVAVTIALTTLGGGGRYKLKGNAGVVALYEFFCEQQENQLRLAGNTAKEIGHRIMREPFEIDARMDLELEGIEDSFFPINSITLGLDVKYDMKDFGIKAGAMGIEAFGAYIIDDDLVVSLMGQAASTPLNIRGADKLKKDMGLGERVKMLLPFLPKNDDVSMELLETLSVSVPDKYTHTGSEEAYSPKEQTSVSMDVITTTLDSTALREIAANFSRELDGNKRLRREVQRMLDDFAFFAGMEEMDLSKLLEDLEDSAESEVLDNIEITWSVYSLKGSYVGASFKYTDGETKATYIYMSEFGGYESFVSIDADINGSRYKQKLHNTWKDNKITMDGEISTGGIAQIISAYYEFSKENGNKYRIKGDMTVPGTVNKGTYTQESTSYSLSFDADILIGGGLETLKESRDWNRIYSKEWGRIEDVFGWLMPGGFLDYDLGNRL